MFGGNFAPAGWALCDGQLLQVTQNEALFSLLGTTYGGDGRTTYGLPDLRGRIPIHQGQGPGLSNRPIGRAEGQEQETLVANELPVHRHTLQASGDVADQTSPSGNVLAHTAASIYANDTAVAMAPAAISATGGSQSHTNLMPFQCVTFIISLFGVYPSRT